MTTPKTTDTTEAEAMLVTYSTAYQHGYSAAMYDHRGFRGVMYFLVVVGVIAGGLLGHAL